MANVKTMSDITRATLQIYDDALKQWRSTEVLKLLLDDRFSDGRGGTSEPDHN
jgi:hypothetical protein